MSISFSVSNDKKEKKSENDFFSLLNTQTMLSDYSSLINFFLELFFLKFFFLELKNETQFFVYQSVQSGKFKLVWKRIFEKFVVSTIWQQVLWELSQM
jgi:hypothetical protein